MTINTQIFDFYAAVIVEKMKNWTHFLNFFEIQVLMLH